MLTLRDDSQSPVITVTQNSGDLVNGIRTDHNLGKPGYSVQPVCVVMIQVFCLNLDR